MEKFTSEETRRENVFAICKQMGAEIDEEKQPYAAVYVHAVALPVAYNENVPQALLLLQANMYEAVHDDNMNILEWVEDHLPEGSAERQLLISTARQADVALHALKSSLLVMQDALLAAESGKDVTTIAYEREQEDQRMRQSKALLDAIFGREEADTDDDDIEYGDGLGPDAGFSTLRHLPKLSD